jgi:hypothetical protein
MAASASGPSGSSGNVRPFREPAEATDGQLLEKVLEQTLARINEGVLFEAPDMNALKEVARRHRGQRLSLDPVAVELVQAAMRPQFGSLALTPQVWQQLTTQVARMLVEDPTAHDRLQGFWDRLSQVP